MPKAFSDFISISPTEKAQLELITKFKGSELMRRNSMLYFFHPSDSVELTDASTLTVIENPTRKQIQVACELALIDYNERGNVEPPVPAVYVLADF